MRNISPATVFAICRLLPYMFFGIGVVSMYQSWVDFSGARSSLNWPHTHGNVIESSISDRARNADTGLASLVFRYRYEVLGESHINDRLMYGGLIRRRDVTFVKSFISRHPVGKSVDVFYNPKNPKESVLKPGFHGWPWFLPSLGFLFVLLGVGFFGVDWEEAWANREEGGPSMGSGSGTRF